MAILIPKNQAHAQNHTPTALQNNFFSSLLGFTGGASGKKANTGEMPSERLAYCWLRHPIKRLPATDDGELSV
jgi:hypothetical protein